MTGRGHSRVQLCVLSGKLSKLVVSLKPHVLIIAPIPRIEPNTTYLSF